MLETLPWFLLGAIFVPLTNENWLKTKNDFAWLWSDWGSQFWVIPYSITWRYSYE